MTSAHDAQNQAHRPDSLDSGAHSTGGEIVTDDQEGIDEKLRAWRAFGREFLPFCGENARIVLKAVYPHRDDPDVLLALKLAEAMTYRKLTPERLDPELSAAMDAAAEKRLRAIVAKRAKPKAVARRRKEFLSKKQSGESNYSADELEMRSSPDFGEWLGLKYELFVFFKRALSFMAGTKNGSRVLKSYGATSAGKASGSGRSKPKADFHEWARAVLKNRKMSRYKLAEKYVSEVKPTFKLPKVRGWLTPRQGWNPPPGTHPDD